MQKFRKILSSSLLIGTMLYSLPTHANTPKAVTHVDIQRYAGDWYEIARLPMFFQNKCAKNAKANYQLQADGSVKVINECVKKSGEPMKAVGNAILDNGSTSQLLVTFIPTWLQWLPLSRAGYWVLALDANYQYALVGTPNNKYLWLLSRSKTMPNDVYEKYVNIAQSQGYDVSKLQKTLQD